MKKITILGSNSGRNAGDAAILASIIDGVAKLNPDTLFEVPTTNPKFINSNYGHKYKVKPISIMPWNFSVRLLGIPVLRSIARSDLVLITDGIIFDVKLFNPAFNFLITLIFLVPFANLLKKPVVCFCVGIGPITTFWGKLFTKFVGNRCKQIMVREKDSYDLMKELGTTTKMGIYADIAFTNKTSPIDTKFLDKKRKTIGINVTRYCGIWLKGKESKVNKEHIISSFASVIDSLSKELDAQIVLITTQIMDIQFADKIKQQTKNPSSVLLVTNQEYSNHEITHIMSKLDLFLGMRLHSLILASSVGVPVVGLVYAPKVLSFMKLLGLENYSIDLTKINAQSLHMSIKSFWENKETIKKAVSIAIPELKKKANLATEELVNNYL